MKVRVMSLKEMADKGMPVFLNGTGNLLLKGASGCLDRIEIPLMGGVPFEVLPNEGSLYYAEPPEARGRYSVVKWACVVVEPDPPVVEEMTLAQVCDALGKTIKIIKD